MDLQTPPEKTTDPDFLLRVIGCTTLHLMELEVEGRTGDTPGVRGRSGSTNVTAIGTRIPGPGQSRLSIRSAAQSQKLRKCSDFLDFLEPWQKADKALTQ